MQNPNKQPTPAGTLVKANRAISLLEQLILATARKEQTKVVKGLAKSLTPNSFETLLPYAAGVAEEYRNKASLRELATKFHATLPTIRRLLEHEKCEIRSFGRIAGKELPAYEIHSKITAEQKEWILQRDLAGIEHAEIAGQVGISRERVRQICQEAGHEARRTVMREQREQRLLNEVADTAIRKAKRQEKLMTITAEVELAAKMWAQGSTIAEVADAIGAPANTVGVKLSRWRKRWPDLFPGRYAKNYAD